MIIQNIILILLNLLEAKHDFYVIKGADANNILDNRKWHKWGGIFAVALGCYMSYYVSPVLGPMYISYRAVAFPMFLNLYRGKPLFYLSNAGFEGWFVRKRVQFLYYLGGILSIIVLNYI